jgi:hypothetical protein
MPLGGVGSLKRCPLSMEILKFKYENVIKIKNKPYPGISRTYYLI